LSQCDLRGENLLRPWRFAAFRNAILPTLPANPLVDRSQHLSGALDRIRRNQNEGNHAGRSAAGKLK
jgi:hypothetical protein